jgi:hypothetical protein
LGKVSGRCSRWEEVIGLNLWKLGCKNQGQIELDQGQVLGFIAFSAASEMELIFFYYEAK